MIPDSQQVEDIEDDEEACNCGEPLDEHGLCPVCDEPVCQLCGGALCDVCCGVVSER